MIKTKYILYGLVVLAAIFAVVWNSFDLGPPWGITEEEDFRQGYRNWVLRYKLSECDEHTDYKRIQQAMIEIQQTLDREFGSSNRVNKSLKTRYRFAIRYNQLLEQAIVEIKGKEVLDSIAGKWTPTEAYGSVEEAKATLLKCEEARED